MECPSFSLCMCNSIGVQINIAAPITPVNPRESLAGKHRIIDELGLESNDQRS